MSIQIFNYLIFRKNGLINCEPEGLRITKELAGIKVENIYQGRVLCSIIFNEVYRQGNLILLEIQTMTKKGTLSTPQVVGLYTSECEKLESIPNRPDEKQANALESIAKKINVVLKPLNDEAWIKSKEQTKQAKRKTLSLNKPNNNKRKY